MFENGVKLFHNKILKAQQRYSHTKTKSKLFKTLY